MPHFHFLRNCCAAVILLFPFGAAAQWTSLFDGRTLHGWKQLNGLAKYEVIGQEIVGTSVAQGGNSFLVTDQNYRDFVLQLDFKIDDHTNSGIQVRSESKQDYQQGRVHGYQVEIDPSQRSWTGGLYDEGRRDWLYPLEYNPSAKTAFKRGEWNKLRIECIGNSIRAWINGVPTCHVVDDLTSTGFIALQVHAANKPEEIGQQTRWRNIQIQTKNIQPSPLDNLYVLNLLPNQLSAQEKKNGMTLLWDGKSGTGWMAAGADNNLFPAHRWSMQDGILQTRPRQGNDSLHGRDILTEKEYGNFDLQFEFRFEPGANSGVKYMVVGKTGEPGSGLGLEYQIIDDDYYMKGPAPEKANHALGSLYDLLSADKSSRGIHKVGEWNQARIVCLPDQRVEHWLNGYKIVSYRRGGPQYDSLISMSKYKGITGFGLGSQGHILIQDHGGIVSFRSIKIIQL